MPETKGTIRNVILCEDIRSEIGNKKSIMGIFSGDVIVAEFPARIQFAVYMEYIPEETSEPHEIELDMMADDNRIAEIKVKVTKPAAGVTSLIIPRAIVAFEKEASYSIFASISQGPRFEILRKKIQKGEVQPR